MVLLTSLPPGLVDGLPQEDQDAIVAIVGKPVLLVGYDEDRRAELHFDDRSTVGPASTPILTRSGWPQSSSNGIGLDRESEAGRSSDASPQLQVPLAARHQPPTFSFYPAVVQNARPELF
jgi:hypothetical protein